MFCSASLYILGAVVGSSFGFVFFLLLSYKNKREDSLRFDVDCLIRQESQTFRSIRKINKRLNDARF